MYIYIYMYMHMYSDSCVRLLFLILFFFSVDQFLAASGSENFTLTPSALHALCAALCILLHSIPLALVTTRSAVHNGTDILLQALVLRAWFR